jgi:8-amino-7-oxononanoate synthase
MSSHRNTLFVVRESAEHYRRAINSGLMQVTITGRDGKRIVLPDGREVVEFVNCSTLGLDIHPDVIEASKSVDDMWGVHFTCARSRLSIEPQQLLEEELSDLYRGRVITFPSALAAHISVMPLLASGILAVEDEMHKMCFIFDKFAHSTLQYLKPVVAAEATVVTIAHNSLAELSQQVLAARERGETAVYVADGVYSMGGLCPMPELLALSEELGFSLFIDDAHGMGAYGERGEGFALSHVEGDIPDRMMVSFSLGKGFGAYGGGIVVPGRWREHLIRSFGQVNSFSASHPFQSVFASRAVVRLHNDGTIKSLQKELRARVALYDELMGESRPFSPIRMIPVGRADDAITAGERLLDEGYYVSVVFFPVVARNSAQLRVILAANHSEDDVKGLVESIKRVQSDLTVSSATSSS